MTRFRPHELCGVGAVGAALLLATGTPAVADEDYARQKVKEMSDYMAGQQAISLDFDAGLEVVTADGEKLTLASSGDVVVNRPDKLLIRRKGGFADVEMIFDGKELTVFGKTANAYAQIDAPGTTDALFETLREKFNVPAPGADLLTTDIDDALMAGVTEVKDLGSGVVGGVECDHFAARGEYADWQIWVAQGEQPYPCMYVITSRDVEGGPQYAWRISNFQAGGDAETATFAFDDATGATKVELDALKGLGDLPDHFKPGAKK